MRRLMRINEFWRWLPVFRAVAEEEHLTRAAQALHLSPSALSRTISLLEETVGEPLFYRRHRRLQLTRSGRVLLDTVRSAMRLVDDALGQVQASLFSGPARVSAPAALVVTVATALAGLREDYPDLVPQVLTRGPEEVRALLLRGELDVALVEHARGGDQLEAHRIATLAMSVYCGPSHAVAQVRQLTTAEVLRHLFVAPEPDSRGGSPDGWPAGLERRVGLYVSERVVPLEICTGGELLAVFPDVTAADWVEAGRLRRLPVRVVDPRPLFAVRRVQLSEGDLAQTLTDRVRSALQ